MAEPDTTSSPAESIVSTVAAGSANAPTPSDWAPPWQPPFLESFTAGIPTPEKVEKFEKDQSGRLETKLLGEGLIEKQREADDAQNQSMLKRKYNQVAASTEDLKPWNAQTMAPQPTSLWEKLGSPGFIFAMLGSSFSAMPMNTAMAAGGAAINAINQGDMEGYNRAFDEWKVNSNLAIQRHNMEQSEFEDIVKIGGVQNANTRAKLEMLALKYNDESALALYKNGMDKEAMDAREGRVKAMEEYIRVVPAMMEQHALIQGVQDKVKAGVPYPKAFNDTVADLEKSKHAYYDLRAGKSSAISPGAVADLKSTLASALGHDLPPDLATTIEGGLAGAKGTNAAKIVSAVTSEVRAITDDVEAGKKVSDGDALKRIKQAIDLASTSTARSGQTAYYQTLIRNHPEKANDPEWIKKQMGLYAETLSAARVLGSREGNIAISVQEIGSFGEKAIAARKKLGGSSITPINSLEQLKNRSTGVKGQGDLDVYTAEVLTAYATALSRGNSPTVKAQERAIELLHGAYSVETFTERVRAMQDAAQVIKDAAKDASKETIGEPDEPTADDFTVQ